METLVTTRELARMIREANNIKDLPKNIKIVDGNVTLSEGKGISLFSDKIKEDSK